MGDIDPALVENFTLELGGSAELVLSLTLAVMMFSVALGLRPGHFSFLRDQPRLFFTGLAAQLLALPLLTLILCLLLSPLPSVALGMILIACCPGGNVSNMLVVLARGNVALSVSLTAASSLAAAFVTPAAILFWSGLYTPTAQLLNDIEFDALSFLAHTTVILALPLLLGMSVAAYSTELAQRLRRPLISVSTIALFALILFGVVKYLDMFVTIGMGLIVLVIAHNAAAFILGNLIARLARVDTAARRTITFEVGIQNSGLGIVILLTQLGGLGGAAVVAGLWSTWHIATGLLLVFLFRTSTRL